MRKLITISFLTVYLFGNTELGQLANLPKLVNHYHQHHFLNPQVGFFDFIAEHYFGDDGMTSDDQQDNELPFKQLHKPFSSISFVVPAFASFNSNIITIAPRKLTLRKDEYPQSGFFTLHLRPPEFLS